MTTQEEHNWAVVYTEYGGHEASTDVYGPYTQDGALAKLKKLAEDETAVDSGDFGGFDYDDGGNMLSVVQLIREEGDPDMKLSEMPNAAEPTVNLLMEYGGWMLAKIHGDGVIDLVKLVDGREVRLFVSPTGWAGVPRTHETMLAMTSLLALGLEIPSFGASRAIEQEARRKGLREGILIALESILSSDDPPAEQVLEQSLQDEDTLSRIVGAMRLCQDGLTGRDALLYILDAAAVVLK